VRSLGGLDMQLARVLLKAWSAARYAHKRRILGSEFDRFGRSIGCRLLLKRDAIGFHYLVAPVSSMRYFEFPFALSCLPPRPARCLDLASPRLLSLYAASKGLCERVDVLNPDVHDAAMTDRIARLLNLETISVATGDAKLLESRPGRYDVIWSLSVLEHICGEYDDRQAIEWMFRALRPGGRLIVTVPVDRACWDEYRDEDPYGTQSRARDGRYFFQRFYDAEAIAERLTGRIGVQPDCARWYGERARGVFGDYESRWMAKGLECVVNDAVLFANEFAEYATWESMPGVGVCGLLYTRHDDDGASSRCAG
jgi:SAM-dependent methyltransferase